MKILHLYAGNLYGGIESYLVTLARQQSLVPEMRPEFGLCFPGRLRDELLETGMRVHDLGGVRLSRPWTVWRARRRLGQILRSGDPDVVAVHGCWPHVVFGPVVRRRGVKLVHVLHDNLANRNWLERRAASCPPNLVLANSRFTAIAGGRIFTQSPIHVCYYPVSTPVAALQNVRNTVREELGTLPQATVILQASRLERWKGQSILLSALNLLKANLQWEFWLAGGPQRSAEENYFAELRRSAQQMGIANRIRFLGQRTDVRRLMAAADLFCQPNTCPEPFGIVFVEALLAGLPVVTSNFGAAPEIINESCGRLIPPCNAEKLAAGLDQLLEDAALRKALSQHAAIRGKELCDPQQQLLEFNTLIGSA